MHSRRTTALPFLLLAAACHSTPDPLPPGHGLVSFDRAAPAGAESFPAPQWKVGDRFVFLKGGRVRIAARVDVCDAERVELVDEQSGARTLMSAEFAELGQRAPDSEQPALSFDPGDQRFSWPLWVGKRWACEFVNRAPERADVPFLAAYQCDAVEDVATPAGTFRCLRIWRRVRVAAAGEYIERVSVSWYAPAAGVVVRRLDDGIEMVLLEQQRQ